MVAFTTAQAAYAAFALAAGLLVITPGLDTALVLRTTATDGVKHAALVAIGTCCGVLIWGGVVAGGLGAALETSERLYTGLRWLGAAYLAYMGGSFALRPRQQFIVVSETDTFKQSRLAGPPKSFLRGLLSNLMNPKIAVFYVTFLPQFVPLHANVPSTIVTLSAIQAAEGLIWFTLLLSATQSVRRWLRAPRVVAILDRATGIVLIGFAARLVWSDR